MPRKEQESSLRRGTFTLTLLQGITSKRCSVAGRGGRRSTLKHLQETLTNQSSL